MKVKDIFDAIGNVRDELIEKTAFIDVQAMPRINRISINRRLWIAACVAAALLLGALGIGAIATLTEAWFKSKQTEAVTEIEAPQICEDGRHIYTVGNTCDVCDYTIPVTAGLIYEINDSVCAISGIGDTADTDIHIPAFYGTYMVESIYENAFKNCDKLTSIEIPTTIKSIGKGAFDGCTGLLVFDGGVAYADKWAVASDQNATEVNLRQNTVGIAAGTFEHCELLTDAVIPEGVTSIGNKAFEGCYALLSIKIPDSVTYLGDGAFYACVELTNVSIGNGILSIGKDTFNSCVRMNSIALGSNIKRIGEQAFQNCRMLKSISIPEGVRSIGGYAFSGCEALEEITVPDSVALIEWAAFRDCVSLESITLGRGLSKIEGHVFRGCESLISVTIPASVKSIGSGAFMECSWLAKVTFEDTYGWSVNGKLVDVSKPSTNMINLVDVYGSYEWKKTN